MNAIAERRPVLPAPESSTPANSKQHAYYAGFTQWLAGRVSAALADEANLTPKPGLVDRHGNGAHHDMNLAMMHRSIGVLESWFDQMAQAALVIDDGATLRDELGHLGRLAEADMLTATGGVNTHRGAIWALGLLVAAAAQKPGDLTPERVAQRAALLAQRPDRRLKNLPRSKGAHARTTYGVGGAHAQACAAFPSVIAVGLPQLRFSRQSGAGESAARLNALLAIMAQLDDTCLLARGGLKALRAVQNEAGNILALGGTQTFSGRHALHQLCKTATTLHVSPGGSADLLAATLLLDRLGSVHPFPYGAQKWKN